MTFASLNEINIRPEVTILSVLQHLPYKPWFALGEFVDNALQSMVSNREALEAIDGPSYRLRVEIRIDRENNVISIHDNAAGISSTDFPRAFRPAELPADRRGLSEFGMGMKAASCWFTNTWVVRTKAIGEPVERLVRFDIQNIINGKSETLSVEEKASPLNDHFTEIRLLNLGDRLPQTKTVKKLRDHLASIYREFLRTNDLVLKFDREELSFEEPEILEVPPYDEPTASPLLWRKAIQFDFGLGLSVTGFAALRKIGSTTHAGFSLFRRKRLIEGSGDETYRPQEIFGNSNSYRYQRLFGELHLEGFQVSHTKDGFRWEENEEVFLQLLKEHLRQPPLDLLEQAENFRTLQSRNLLEKRAQEATRSVAEAIESQMAGLLEEEMQLPTQQVEMLEQLVEVDSALGKKRIRIQVSGQPWDIVVACIVDSAIFEFVRIASREIRLSPREEMASILEIELNLGHPFARSFNGPNGENTELLVRLGSSICLAEVLAAQTKPESKGRVLFHFNEVLREVLSEV